MAMAMRSLARKLMPVSAALRWSLPSCSLHHEDKLLKGMDSYFEENPEIFAELFKRYADKRRHYRMMALSGASAYGVVFFTLLYLRNREKYMHDH